MRVIILLTRKVETNGTLVICLEQGGGGVVGFFLAYPFELNQQFTEYRFLTDTNKSVTVPAGTFDCIVTEMIPKPDYAGFYEELIFSKNIGLIRYQLSKAQGVWELIDYHLQ